MTVSWTWCVAEDKLKHLQTLTHAFIQAQQTHDKARKLRDGSEIHLSDLHHLLCYVFAEPDLLHDPKYGMIHLC